MTVVACIGSRGEMLFGGRRVSRDAHILADLAGLGGRLLCHPFSEAYLKGAGLSFTVCEDLLTAAGRDDVCFIEHLPLAPHIKRIDRLILYDFGEVYPFDVTLDIDPCAAGFSLASSIEFAGKAHKCIKKEIFEK